MVGRKRSDMPKALARGRHRFEEWRRTRKNQGSDPGLALVAGCKAD